MDPYLPSYTEAGGPDQTSRTGVVTRGEWVGRTVCLPKVRLRVHRSLFVGTALIPFLLPVLRFVWTTRSPTTVLWCLGSGVTFWCTLKKGLGCLGYDIRVWCRYDPWSGTLVHHSTHLNRSPVNHSNTTVQYTVVTGFTQGTLSFNFYTDGPEVNREVSLS